MAQAASSRQITASPRLWERLVGGFFHYLRLIIGCIFIVIGILGIILPVLPGTIWLIIATLLIGKRSRVLRRASIVGKRWLRAWAAHDQPLVRRLGRWSVAAQRDTSCRLRRVNWRLAAWGDSLRRRLVRA